MKEELFFQTDFQKLWMHPFLLLSSNQFKDEFCLWMKSATRDNKFCLSLSPLVNRSISESDQFQNNTKIFRCLLNIPFVQISDMHELVDGKLQRSTLYLLYLAHLPTHLPRSCSTDKGTATCCPGRWWSRRLTERTPAYCSTDPSPPSSLQRVASHWHGWCNWRGRRWQSLLHNRCTRGLQ